MQKKLFILILSFSIVGICLSQNSIAKLKFEEAEEAITKNDFKRALSKVDEVEKMLGAVNPKTSYLRILSLDKLVDDQDGKDSETIILLKNNCDFYLKNYESSSVEDKFKDVYKISEKVKKYTNYKIGYNYYNKKNYPKAIEWFTKGANEGDAEAMWQLGFIYHRGENGLVDFKQALRWFIKASELGDANSFHWIGTMYADGEGVEQDLVKALNYYKQGAALGNAMAMNKVGYYYEAGLTVPKDYIEARKWYQKAIDSGNDVFKIGAKYIGDMYRYGIGLEKSYAETINWYLKTENILNVKEDLYPLVDTLLRNKVKFDEDGVTRFIHSYKKIIGTWDEEVYQIFGMMNEKRNDFVQAIAEYTKGASVGNAACMQHLARIYKNGLGVKKDKKLAEEWQLKSEAAKTKK